MIEICLKDDNMHRFVMINALICINIYVITCIISMLSPSHTVVSYGGRIKGIRDKQEMGSCTTLIYEETHWL